MHPDTEDRVNRDVNVIHLGDLIHAGKSGSRTGDQLLACKADDWFDEWTYGNHDLAVFDGHHMFSGFDTPSDITIKAMLELRESGKLKYATMAHGFIICHAGVHKRFDVEPKFKNMTSEELVAFANENPLHGIVSAVGHARFGRSPVGGIIWMDWKMEKHSQKFKYICGHTSLGYRKRKEDPNCKSKKDEWGNWNIDLGTPENGTIAGIWLPDERPVQVTVGRKLDNKFRQIADKT